MGLTLASLLGVYKIKTPALVECTFCLRSKEIKGGMTINRIDKYKLCIYSVRNSKEVRVATADLLKGKVVGEVGRSENCCKHRRQRVLCAIERCWLQLWEMESHCRNLITEVSISVLGFTKTTNWVGGVEAEGPIRKISSNPSKRWWSFGWGR